MGGSVPVIRAIDRAKLDVHQQNHGTCFIFFSATPELATEVTYLLKHSTVEEANCSFYVFFVLLVHSLVSWLLVR